MGVGFNHKQSKFGDQDRKLAILEGLERARGRIQTSRHQGKNVSTSKNGSI